jgi:hypothetical protein
MQLSTMDLQLSINNLEIENTDEFLRTKVLWEIECRRLFSGFNKQGKQTIKERIRNLDTKNLPTIEALEKIITEFRTVLPTCTLSNENKWRRREKIIEGMLGDAIFKLSKEALKKTLCSIVFPPFTIDNPGLCNIIWTSGNDQPALISDYIIKGDDSIILVEIKIGATFNPMQAFKYFRLINAFNKSDDFKNKSMRFLLLCPNKEGVFRPKTDRWLEKLDNTRYVVHKDKSLKIDNKIKNKRWYREFEKEKIQKLFNDHPIQLISFKQIQDTINSLEGKEASILNARQTLEYIVKLLEH